MQQEVCLPISKPMHQSKQASSTAYEAGPINYPPPLLLRGSHY